MELPPTTRVRVLQQSAQASAVTLLGSKKPWFLDCPATPDQTLASGSQDQAAGQGAARIGVRDRRGFRNQGHTETLADHRRLELCLLPRMALGRKGGTFQKTQSS